MLSQDSNHSTALRIEDAFAREGVPLLCLVLKILELLQTPSLSLMKVYSQSAKAGEPRYLQAVQGDYWFSLRGYEIVKFTYDQLLAGELDEDLQQNIDSVLVYGAVSVVREAVRRAGRPDPPNLDFPFELREFLRRPIFETTMGAVRRWQQHESERLPVHIKPRDRHKMFTGKVVRAFRDLISLAEVPDNEPLFAQGVVNLVSEWRASVLRNKIIHVGHYKGNPLLFPDPAVIEHARQQFSTAPIGYGMDWAVDCEGQTILVEVNDGFSLGNYGVPGSVYTALIECRWRELMGLPDNGVGLEP